MNHQPKLSGIAAALASHGRNGDTELLHVSKSELAALKAAGAPAGINLTKNPETGLYEAFNWMGTLGGVVGGIIGTVIAPGAGTAAGAAIGAGLGTAAGGGSTQQILTSAVISGIGGYVGGGGLSSLAEAGGKTIAEEATKTAVETGAETAIQEGGKEAIGSGLTNVAGNQITGGAASNIEPAVQNVAQNAGQQAASNASFMDTVAAGWKATPGMFGGQGDALMKTGVAALGVGAINPGSSQIVTPQTSPTSSANPYKAEIYYTPDGQKRTRVVKAARGGAIYGDYDGVEEAQADDGYMTGGTTYMATGGIANAPAVNADAAKNPANTIYRGNAFDVYAEDLQTPVNAGNRTMPTPNVLDKGFFSKGEYAVASPEKRAEMDQLMSAKQEFVPSPMRKQYQNGFAAGGGIGDLGGYSDGGRLLKGPGDGVSDSIPADIEGKKPARLADGEFVIPARAVSELGNGSTEAGSKQLYAMLDRIAAKRKSGKGLAYEASPKKLMPA